MAQEKLYLGSSALVEPLVDQWYAWSQLISPAQAAMQLVERHLKIMDSYIKAPHVHVAAVNNPAMLGGPFINYGGERVGEIRELLERTRRARKQMIDLHKAIKDLDELLRNEARGASLEPLYSKVPGSLRGYVELVYDLNNHPSFRLLENLLYRSPFYDEGAQSVMLSTLESDDRPFILSTPRLEDEQHLHLRLPLRHEGLDALFSMSSAPQSLAWIRERLDIGEAAADALRKLLTAAPPRACPPWRGEGVRWRYFGHACVLVESQDVSILLDPVLSYGYPTALERYTLEDLPDRIDYVLITHAHADHVMLETLLRLRHKIGSIVVPRAGGGALQDPSLKSLLSAIGFRDVRELDTLEEISLDGGRIIGFPFLGEHGDLDIRSKLAYRIELGGHALLFAADSSNLEPQLYAHLRRACGETDVLFLGMECDGAPMSWIYGPLLTRPLARKDDQTRRLAGSNFERALGIVEALGCKEVYVYAMGQEPWLGYVMSVKYNDQSLPIVASNKLLAACAERGLRAERLFCQRESFLSPRTSGRPEAARVSRAAAEARGTSGA
jgi:L-ascorbate metabolism protein UlaG (beta-lactamase superfamily)